MGKEFGKEAPLTVSHYKVHEYLGMKLDFTENGAITIDKIVKTIVANMPEEMVGEAPTPASNHVFHIREGPVPIERRKPIRPIKSTCSGSISVTDRI